MPEYARDDGGTVHLLRPPQPWFGVALQQRFRFCDRDGASERGVSDFTASASDDEPCSGPVTCLQCRIAVQDIRDAIRGVRWARSVARFGR